MPPRKRTSAPAGRVYTSGTPLQQTTLKSGKKTVKYGKQGGVRIPKPKQETLTQIWDQPTDMLSAEEDIDEQEPGRSGLDIKVEAGKKRRRTMGDVESAPKKSKAKRRRTMGDELVEDGDEIHEDASGKRKEARRTTGDIEAVDSTSKPSTKTGSGQNKSVADTDDSEIDEELFEEMSKPKKGKRKSVAKQRSNSPDLDSQQTITQLWSFTTENEEDDAIFDVPSSSQPLHVPKSVAKLKKPGETLKTNPPASSPVQEMPPPQTPRRTLAQEIPSSQSPATPFSIHSRGSARTRSPLKEKSVNTPIPFNTGRKSHVSPEKLPKLVIEDTFETGTDISQLQQVPSTPSKRSSPAKSVRFALPIEEDENEEEEAEEEEQPPTPSRKLQGTPRPTARSVLEIQDSDADSDEDLDFVETRDYEEELIMGTIGTAPAREAEVDDSGDENEEEEEPETCYGEIGVETQRAVDRIVQSSQASLDLDAGEIPMEDVRGEEISSTREHLRLSPAKEDIHADVEESQQDESADEGDVEMEETNIEKTQMMESQRLATQHMNTMAPRTANSDIFISIASQHVGNIVNGTKDHEFRTWSFAPSVRRIWIYETKPISQVKYMAEIGPVKHPGEIVDEKGIGNAEFSSGRSIYKFAYEILQLYPLADPKTLKELTDRGWLKTAPVRFNWVRPAVLDELMGNIMPPLFDRDENPSSSSTDTQEAGEQLLSTIRQFTQPATVPDLPSSPPPKAATAPLIPSSPLPVNRGTYNQISLTAGGTSTPRRSQRNSRYPPPSQATTVDLSQPQTPLDSQAEIIWESPARPIPVQSSTPHAYQTLLHLQSSTPRRLPSSPSRSNSRSSHHLPSPRHPHSSPHVPSQHKKTNQRQEISQLESDSVVPYSMASSQLLTKSQLFPESLLGESMPGPPVWIDDEDEDEIED